MRRSDRPHMSPAMSRHPCVSSLFPVGSR
jgi:hypothetical protein